MELSCKARYALLALLELANYHKRGAFVQIDQIAGTHQIPTRYLAQLLTKLRRGGLIRSQRGTKGGYLLAKEPCQITVSEVIDCLEETNKRQPESQTASATPECAAIEEVWKEATKAGNSILQRHTLQELCEKRDESKQLNTMYYI